jgi:hypothetical protein
MPWTQYANNKRRKPNYAGDASKITLISGAQRVVVVAGKVWETLLPWLTRFPRLGAASIESAVEDVLPFDKRRSGLLLVGIGMVLEH